MTNEVFYMILGLIMMYSTVHFFVIQFITPWSKRTTYEKVVTIVGIVSISLLYLGVIAEG